MSAARDFEVEAARSRANTAATQNTAPLSPVARQTTSIDRRGSTTSRHSTTPTEKGLRFKRTNTVTTYHHPEPTDPQWQPGAEPGIDPTAEDENLPKEVNKIRAQCDINIIDFSEDEVFPRTAENDTLAALLEEPRPVDMPCRWISVNGLSWDVIQCLGKKYHLHRLAIEDIIKTNTRTKVDWYADHACIILTLQKLVMLHKDHYKEDITSYEDADYQDVNDADQSEKPAPAPSKPRKLWWRKPKKQQSPLPYYLDKDRDGKIDEYVNAHSNTSADSQIKPTRTLHRYESAQIPEHTAFMEKHSTLAPEGYAVSVEQVAIFLLSDNTVISFFEQSAEDVEGPIRERLRSTETILRRSYDASLLVQAIIDAIVDLAVPVRDAYNKARKELQVDAMISPNISTSRALHIFGEEIDMLQNLIKPIVHLVNALRDHNAEQLPAPQVRSPASSEDQPTPMKSEKTKRDREGAPVYGRKMSEYRRTDGFKSGDGASSVAVSPLAHVYFGDVLDHCITMIQAMEQMDASATNISTLIFNTVGARTNNFMMILAIVTVLFAPLTFISGYFGQNFANGSGLNHPFGFFWVVAVPAMAVFVLLVFATMLWDNIKNWLAKRGIKAHRHRRSRVRRAKGY